MAEKSFNPYGSAISRTGLFVYDPTKGVDRALAMGQKAFEQPLQKLEAQRAQDIQYAQDIFDNLGELLDQGELEHNNLLNAEVENLIEETKKNMVSRGKGGGITSLNFNNPNFQTQLQTGIKKIRNGINNSKLLKDQYNDLVTYLNTNKDVVSNQIGIINEAAAKLLDPRNLFTSNNVVNDFTTLKNNAIDEVKYISSVTEGLLDVTDKQTLTYEAVDSRGKNITISGEFNKDIYVTDEMGVIQRDSNGKPELDIERVKALRDGIKEDPMTPPQAVEWLKNDANFEQFKDMISADLIIKERTALEEANLRYREAATAATNRSNRSEEITTTNLYNITTSSEFKLYDVEGTELSANNTAEYVNIPESEYLTKQTLGGIPIPAVIGIGYQNGKKALVIKRGDDNVVVTAGSNYADAFDSKVLQDLSGKDLVISEQSMNEAWDQVDTEAQAESFKGDDTEIYKKTLNNALILSKNTQSVTPATLNEELSNLNNLVGESIVDNNDDDKVVKEKTLEENIREYNSKNKENSIGVEEFEIIKDGLPVRNSDGEIKAKVTPENIDTFVYDKRKGGENNLASAFDSRQDFEDYILKTKEIFNSQEYQDMLNRYNKFNEYLNNE